MKVLKRPIEIKVDEVTIKLQTQRDHMHMRALLEGWENAEWPDPDYHEDFETWMKELKAAYESHNVKEVYPTDDAED